jgi:hypothetical protein
VAAQKKGALGWLKRVSAETTDLSDRLTKTSERAADRTSEVLFGVLGASVALVATYAITVVAPLVSLPILGPIAACVGISGGILTWRGRQRFRLEKHIKSNRIKADEIMERIKLLPKNAPRDVRKALWGQYNWLAAELQERQIAGPKSGTVLILPSPQTKPLALPAPSLNREDQLIDVTPALPKKRKS